MIISGRKMAKSGSLVINNTRLQNKRQKLREERKRVLKICVSKLQNIHDPESYLCKSVLINNTLRNIQLEHREAQKRTRLYSSQNVEYNDLDEEAKKPCLEVGGCEGQIGDDVIVEDVDHGHPLCNSYYDVSSYRTEPVDDVMLYDTALGNVEEESAAENLNNNNPISSGCEEKYQVTYCIDTISQTQSLVQNTSLSLEAFCES